jgi:ribosomal protein L12E/L44/L45/RPP1/RPP2
MQKSYHIDSETLEVIMQRIVINVKDDKKINALVSFLNEINFIDVEKEKKR